jgi:putative tryptophan/tyrosine transport system substrate-binding protein
MRFRRTVIRFGLAAIIFGFSLADAQQIKKIPRVGVLQAGSSTGLAKDQYQAAFRQGLRELGYIEGKNIVLETRFAEGREDRLTALAAELVNSNVDVIVTATTPAVLAIKKATTTIPIVFAAIADPVKSGLVSSLARPGGQVTGLSFTAAGELMGKRLELLSESFPKVKKVGYFTSSPTTTQLENAKDVGLQIQVLVVRNREDFEKAFDAILRERTQAIAMPPTPLMNTHHKIIIEFAEKNRIPAIYPTRDFVDAGGLMSYGINISDLFRRAATYADKILKGAKPGELPVERPTKFEMIINLKTAKQIGLTIPPNVLARADRVIK